MKVKTYNLEYERDSKMIEKATEIKCKIKSWEFCKVLLPENVENNYFFDNIKNTKEKIDLKIKKFLVVVGIGGSSLGPSTICSALENLKQKSGDNIEKTFFIDNLDPFEIKKIENIIGGENLKKTVFIITSKSGKTPETMAAYYYFKDLYQKSGLEIFNHFVFISDNSQNNLKFEAEAEKSVHFPMSVALGGRFSVLSAVGLVIASFLNFNIKDLLKGGRQALQDFENGELAYQIPIQQINHFLEKGKNISVLMPYSKRLENFGKWWVQLTAESLGKEFNKNGKKINTGFTPITAVGATDQHSILQLFKEGPDDKFYIFLRVKNHLKTQIPSPAIPYITNPNLSFLSERCFETVLNVELQATVDSLVESGRPIVLMEIEEINEFNLGYLFVYFEICTAIMGELLEIDTFNQPGVERSKILTRKGLESI